MRRLLLDKYLASGKATGQSSIEKISHVYGNQAVVVSIDPRRVYVKSPDEVPQHVIETKYPGPNGENIAGTSAP